MRRVVAISESRSGKSSTIGRCDADFGADFAADFLMDFFADFLTVFFVDFVDFLDDLERADALAMKSLQRKGHWRI
jgi:hypothetical protein